MTTEPASRTSGIAFVLAASATALLAGAIASFAWLPLVAALALGIVVWAIARRPREAVIILALASPFYDLAVIQISGVADVRILEILWLVAGAALAVQIASGAETRFLRPPRWFTFGIAAIASWFFIAALASGGGLRPVIEAVQTVYLCAIAYLVVGVVSAARPADLERWLRPWALIMGVVLLVSLGAYALGFAPVAQTVVQVPQMSVEYVNDSLLVQNAGANSVEISRLSVLNLGPVGTAAALVSILTVALSVALAHAKRANTRAAWFVLATGALALLLTYSRAGWVLATGAAALVMLAAKSRRATITLSLFILALSLVGSLPSVASRVEEFANVGEGSYQAHARMWVTAAHMIAERPVFGWGPGMYAEKAQAMAINSWMATDISADQPHNWLLEIAAETGVVGGALAVAFIGTLLVYGWRRVKGAPLPVLGVWLATGAYVAMNLTLNAFRTEMMWVWFGALVGVAAWYDQANTSEASGEEPPCGS